MNSAGTTVLRPVETAKIEYEVKRRAWLGYLKPDESRGLLDYLNQNAFIVSHLSIGQIPAMRSDGWLEVDDPDKLAVTIRGSFVTTIGWQVVPRSARMTDFTFRKIAD